MKANNGEDYPHSFVAIDFETIGGKRLYVCQVGMAKYIDGMLSDTYTHLICPPPGAPETYHHVHDITLEDVADEPTFSALLPEMERFVDGLPLVAHNGRSVERACFRQNVEHYGLTTAIDFENIIDTLPMAKAVLPDVSCVLTDLCEHYGICADNHHDAAADAQMCGDLYLQLIEEPNVPSFVYGESKPKKRSSRSTNRSNEKKYNDADMQTKTDLSEYRENPFCGKFVCLTGFDTEDSKTYGAQLSKMGATMRTSVSGKVDILVLGEKPGPSKIKKAENLGIQMMHDFEMRIAISEYFNEEEESADVDGEKSSCDDDLSLGEKVFWLCLIAIISTAGYIYLYS